MNQEEFIGIDSISNINKIIKKTHTNKILLVTGRQSYIFCGAKKKLDKILNDTYTEQFNKFEVNPKFDDVYAGTQLLKNNKFDLVIAVGGGSVIDMAKLINILAVQESKNLLTYVNNNTLIVKKGLPLIAIPTTSGTGSESTHFSVVYIDNIKYSVAHKFMLPDYVIIDAKLSSNLPLHIVAASGIDALSQAVESYWSVKSTEKSKIFASEAIILILKSLKYAVEGDKQARIIMSKAAHLAGKAINITTTTAPHAISYPITTYYGLQHGHAVALTLGSFFEINYNFLDSDIVDSRGVSYLRNTMEELYDMFGVESPLECKSKWYHIMDSIGLESNIESIGISSEKKIDEIINSVNLQRLSNNPVRVSKNTLKKIFL